MAEETGEVLEETGVQEVVEVAPVDSQPEPEAKEEKHPLEIARRIELGKRKAAEARAKEAEERALRAEEKAKLLAEQQERQEKKQEKIYSLSEVNAFVAQGHLTREVADRYIEEVIFPNKAKSILEARDQEQKQRAPLVKAESEVNEYLELIPELKDRSSTEFTKVAAEYRELVAGGSPDSIATQRAAIRKVHGELEQVRRKKESVELSRRAPNMPSDPAGNGGGKPNGKADLSKAPESFLRRMDNLNITDPAARQRAYQNLLDNQKAAAK